MQRTLIKICGLTDPTDALEAVRAGADFVGVVLADSPRQVSLERAEAVLALVPPHVMRVGVFVDAAPDEVAEAVTRLRLDYVQFHGDESPEACAAAPAPVIKAFRVGTGFAPEAVGPYRAAAAAVLLDAHHPHKRGGTGTLISHNIPQLPGGAHLFLAGGLAPTNVAEAVRRVRPFAVDVSSGVEERPGHKDRERMRAFVAAVREADAALAEEPPGRRWRDDEAH